MIRSIASGLLALTIVLPAAAAPTHVVGDGEGWHADFDAAAALAKRQGKDLLVDFLGSDWCHWCIKLDEEVFSHESWRVGVANDYVLVALDFPNSEEAKSKVPNPARNRELVNKYGVRGYPTVLLMTPEGEVFGRTGYQAGGPEKYLKHMAELREGRAALMAAKSRVNKFEESVGDARWEQMGKIIETYTGLGEHAASFGHLLVPAMLWGFENDPDNARGVRVAAAASLLVEGDENADYAEVVRKLDPKNEGGHLEQVVNHAFLNVVENEESMRSALKTLALLDGLNIKDKERYFGFHVSAAILCERYLNDHDNAVRYLSLIHI